jgi:hypothetical protein
MAPRILTLSVAAALLTTATIAQVPPLLPFQRHLDLLVVDSSFDGIWRLADLDQDGDYNDPGEQLVFYSDVGSIALTNPSSITCADDGTVYIADSTVDIILALRDQNGDGDANDPGEFRVCCNSVANGSGILMASVQGLTVDGLGRLWVANANAGTTPLGSDGLYQLSDLNGDGDFDDAGEIVAYCTIPNGGGAVGNSIPTKVWIGPDANVYYAEVGSTGAVTKGVWKLTDLNTDGDCNDPGEVNLLWTPPASASPFYWSLAIDPVGNVYTTDHSTNEQVWRGNDLNQNGTIEPSEQTLFYQTSASTWWDVLLRDDGAVLLVEAQTPDRITVLRDLNADGDALDAGEASQGYDASVAAQAISLRGAALLRAPRLTSNPPIVQIGNNTSFVTEANKPGDLVVVALSVGPAPLTIALPPWGTVEIDVSAFVILGFGLAGPNGSYVQPFAVPNSPTAIGAWALQSLAGDNFRLFLSNSASLQITP